MVPRDGLYFLGCTIDGGACEKKYEWILKKYKGVRSQAKCNKAWR